MASPARVLLLSTYDLGRQPFGLASPAAWLRGAGADVRCQDLSRSPLDAAFARDADLIGIYLPMHTAARLAGPVIRRVHALNPSARICAFGLYAPPNAAWLQSLGVNVVLGPEFEEDLTRLAAGDAPAAGTGRIPRLAFRVPDRAGLPALTRYARLVQPDGTTRVAGVTEATRGCKHRCRHCPIVPVYDGQFRVVPVDVVLGDIRAQVAAGAQHITFADPDFLNGPAHARRVVEALARDFPGVTYDVVVKISHLVQHAALLPVLAATGCVLVTSAVESLDDHVLERLEKGHTRRDVETAVDLLRRAGLPLAPTFIAFTPWTTAGSYLDLLDTIERLDLVEAVAPIQLAMRLLLPRGSRLLELADVRERVTSFDPESLVWQWRHADAAVDALQRDAMRAVAGAAPAVSRAGIFESLRALAADAAGRGRLTQVAPGRPRAAVPYLNEPWYC